MLLQVSPRPGAPGARSTSLWVRYWPAMGAAFSGHSFAPPWLQRFLSSLWFPSQRRCPAAGRERPGEEASCPLGCRAGGGQAASCHAGREEGAPRRVCRFRHRHLVLRFASLILAVLLGTQSTSLVGDATLPVPSPCQCFQAPRSQKQHRSPTAPHTQEQLLELLRHAPLAGIYREAGELNGVTHSSASRPPSSPRRTSPRVASEVKPTPVGRRPPAPALHKERPRDTQAAPARPGRQDGRAKAGGSYFGKQRKLNHNTHTDTN